MSNQRMDIDLLPYQFEPEWQEEELEHVENEPGNARPDQPRQDEDEDRLQNIALWCQCDECSLMPTVKECLCCTEDSANTTDKLHQEPIECIIRHSDFETICLNEAVLEVLMCCLRDVRGYGAQLNWNTRTYRLVSYRAYTFWVHHRLGKRNRRVIPSCAVNAIRNQFPAPDGIYEGYKDVEEAWNI